MFGTWWSVICVWRCPLAEVPLYVQVTSYSLVIKHLSLFKHLLCSSYWVYHCKISTPYLSTFCNKHVLLNWSVRYVFSSANAKATILNEIGRMFSQFGERELACRFFRNSASIVESEKNVHYHVDLDLVCQMKVDHCSLIVYMWTKIINIHVCMYKFISLISKLLHAALCISNNKQYVTSS